MNKETPMIKANCLIYSLLISAYPREFRREYGADMRQVFRDQCLDIAKRTGVIGLIGLWYKTLGDLVRSSMKERLAVTNRWSAALLLFAIVDGLFAAYVDFHNNEVQATVLVIVVCSFVFGVLQPKGAWRWALAVGLGVPGCHIVGRYLGIHSAYPVKPNDFASLIALIPAFIGAYFGALIRQSASFHNVKDES